MDTLAHYMFAGQMANNVLPQNIADNISGNFTRNHDATFGVALATSLRCRPGHPPGFWPVSINKQKPFAEYENTCCNWNHKF